MAYETLRYEQAGHVVTLTYDRPEQHNAVNQLMNRELHDAWQRFRDDDNARGRAHARRAPADRGRADPVGSAVVALRVERRRCPRAGFAPVGSEGGGSEGIRRRSGEQPSILWHMAEKSTTAGGTTRSPHCCFMRRDSHTLGAAAFKAGNLTPQWPHHGL